MKFHSLYQRWQEWCKTIFTNYPFLSNFSNFQNICFTNLNFASDQQGTRLMWSITPPDPRQTKFLRPLSVNSEGTRPSVLVGRIRSHLSTV